MVEEGVSAKAWRHETAGILRGPHGGQDGWRGDVQQTTRLGR